MRHKSIPGRLTYPAERVSSELQTILSRPPYCSRRAAAPWAPQIYYPAFPIGGLLSARHSGAIMAAQMSEDCLSGGFKCQSLSHFPGCTTNIVVYQGIENFSQTSTSTLWIRRRGFGVLRAGFHPRKHLLGGSSWFAHQTPVSSCINPKTVNSCSRWHSPDAYDNRIAVNPCTIPESFDTPLHLQTMMPSYPPQSVNFNAEAMFWIRSS